ncbi:MAG: Xaa-Pro peptidase family protein [SAR202 cluster bacterium]|nr:Xaa-Pro peptidase family protein [SAR202 cluster bacterium]MDP6512349.1 Xaa-Pro peptidase family protein [SAR202 cluster bacterium]MDP6716437.1 Xaa-Pro peptidase family protein [SAR202 cluster bacterium]
MTDSTNLEHALFTRAEMERRWNSARELMSEQGIDALMVSNEENFQYFAGASASLALHHSLTRPSVFILPIERDPIIVTQGVDNLKLGCYVTDLRAYSELLTFPHDTALEAIRDAGANTLGVELGQEQRMGMPVGAYLALVDAAQDVNFVDAAQVIISMRIVKSAEEIAYVRQAADVTGRARQRLFGMIESGMTERDVVRLMRQLVQEEGGDRTSFVILQQDYTGAKNQLPYDRLLVKGDILAVDAGAYVRQYTVDYARMASLGPATDDQKRVHAGVLEVNARMIAALGPGVKCSEMHQIGMQAIADVGLQVDSPGRGKVGRMGHGQGMLITEPPSIAPADDTVLSEGMVISTEPGVRSGDVQFLWEDVHVITSSGSEQLALETPELHELAF